MEDPDRMLWRNIFSTFLGKLPSWSRAKFNCVHSLKRRAKLRQENVNVPVEMFSIYRVKLTSEISQVNMYWDSEIFVSVEGFPSAVSRSWVNHFHIVDLAMRTATMHCVRWDQLLIVFQTRVRERPHSRFKTAFICEQRTIPVFAGKLKAISRVFLNVASCRCAKSTSPTTTSTCIFSCIL